MTDDSDLAAMKIWQQDFYHGIFNPTIENINSACVDMIGTEELTSQDRLTIYRGSILGGITTALTGIYPVCEKLVGEVYFTQMVAGYLRQYPSSSPDIGGYGEYLGDYLEAFIANNTSAQELVYLPDTARLEWLWHRAFNAPNINDVIALYCPVTELAEVAVEDQGKIQFYLDPSIQVMKSEYPVDDIWNMNQQGAQAGAYGETHEETREVSLDAGGKYLMVRRNSDFGMSINEVSFDEFVFLDALNSNLSFAVIAELEFETSVGDVLTTALQSGLIIGFRLQKGQRV
jgi:hypothetical protein